MLSLRVELYGAHNPRGISRELMIEARLIPSHRDAKTFAASVKIPQPATAADIARAFVDLGNIIGSQAAEIDSAN